MAVGERNKALAQALERAQISRKGLALRVNKLGPQYGLSLNYTHTSVARWLDGSTPRGEVPMLICKAISEKLNKPISLRELGLASKPEEISGSDNYPTSVDDLLIRSLQDMHTPATPRRDFMIGAATFSSDLYMRPLLRWLVEPTEDLQTHSRGTKIGVDSVERLLVQIDAIRTLDSQLGGGSMPGDMAKLCLSGEAASAMRGKYSRTVGKQLFSATAELARLAAWTSLDAGEHGTSQKYFIQALRYAKAASDVQFGAFVLGQASYGATFIGDFQTAIDLTTVAMKGAGQQASPKLAAFLSLAQARAYARAGMKYQAEKSLAFAEEKLTVTDEDALSGWLDFMLPSRIAADAAEAYLDLSAPELVLSQNSAALAVPKSSFVRSHGLRLCVIASAYAQKGEKDIALHYGRAAYSVTRRVNSKRLESHFGRFMTAINKWDGEADVEGFRDWLRDPE